MFIRGSGPAKPLAMFRGMAELDSCWSPGSLGIDVKDFSPDVDHGPFRCLTYTSGKVHGRCSNHSYADENGFNSGPMLVKRSSARNEHVLIICARRDRRRDWGAFRIRSFGPS